ncbi:MAG: DUF5067 domain-containing protein [Atopobiaceae bacterium]|nr:DUF5067 domain-containing protein [Atopobiaceae bacterium]
MMSKQLLLSLALGGVLILTGCGSSSSSSKKDTEASASASQEQPAESSASAATESSAAAEQAEEAAPDGKYVVTIDGAQTSTDYAGNPCVIVNYSFTNNSDKATSFMVAVNADVYQNGVECELAIGSDADSSTAMNKIKPGTTIQVQQAYSISDNSDIEVEVAELFSFSDEKLATATLSLG